MPTQPDLAADDGLPPDYSHERLPPTPGCRAAVLFGNRVGNAVRMLREDLRTCDAPRFRAEVLAVAGTVGAGAEAVRALAAKLTQELDAIKSERHAAKQPEPFVGPPEPPAPPTDEPPPAEVPTP